MSKYVTEEIHQGSYFHVSATEVFPDYGLRDACIAALAASPYNSNCVDKPSVIDSMVEALSTVGYFEHGWARYEIEES